MWNEIMNIARLVLSTNLKLKRAMLLNLKMVMFGEYVAQLSQTEDTEQMCLI